MSRRLVRVSEVIRAEVSRLLSRDQALEGSLITVTSVDVVPDLRQAHVFVTTMDEQLDEHTMLSMLTSRTPEWQRQLSKRVKIKYTPRLIFHHDDGQKRGDRIMEILNSIDEPKENPDS